MHSLLQRFMNCTLIFAAVALLAGCGNANPGDAEDTPFQFKIGNATVSVELAIKPATQKKGLMYRDSMGEDEGMLFIFPKPKQMSFWMRNTKIPLDIGYFTADGELKEIYPMYPYVETSVKSKRYDLLYALEVNQGWFERHGIKTGMEFNLEDLYQKLGK